MDFFIPAKSSKDGGKFGFVRFKIFMNMEELLSRLDGMWIGSYKILVKPTRFERRDWVSHKRQPPRYCFPVHLLSLKKD